MNYEKFVNVVEGLGERYRRMNPDMYLGILSSPDGLTVTHGTRAELRKDWVNKMLSEYRKDFKDYSEIVLCDENRKIMVVHFEDFWGDCNGYEGYGISKCSPTDQFDKKVGLAVAYAHFRKYPIPDFV